MSLRRAVAAAPITEVQQFRRERVIVTALFPPPQLDAVARQFDHVVTRVEMQMTTILGHVVDAVRDQRTIAFAREIVVVDNHRLLGVG